MKKNKYNNLVTVLKICKTVVSIICGVCGIIKLLTDESPSEKRKNDEESFRQKRKILEESHCRIKDTDLYYQKELKNISTNSKLDSSEGDEKARHDSPVRSEKLSLEDILSKSDTYSGDSSLIGGYVNRGGIIMVYGADGVGKSSLATQMAVAIANGTPCEILPEHERHANTPQQVIVYDNENTNEDYIERYGNMDKFKNVSIIRSYFECFDDFVNDLEEQTADTEGDVTIVVDSLLTTIPTLNQKDVRALFYKIKNLQNLLDKQGRKLTIVLLNHTTKNQETFFGSSLIGNITTSRIEFKKSTLGDDFRVIEVKKSRKKFDSPKSVIVKRIETPYLYYEFWGYDEQFEPLVNNENPVVKVNEHGSTAIGRKYGYKLTQEVIREINKLSAKKYSYEKIAKSVGVSRKTISRYFNDKNSRA
jgi:archaellum biogenesis ATPase FlaH